LIPNDLATTFLTCNSNQLEPIVRRLSDTIDARQKEIEDLDKRKRDAEDNAFRNFTTRVGIPNIREYEAERMKRQQVFSPFFLTVECFSHSSIF